MLFKRPVSFCVILVRSGCVAPELLRMRRLNQATDWSKLSVPVHIKVVQLSESDATYFI